MRIPSCLRVLGAVVLVLGLSACSAESDGSGARKHSPGGSAGGSSDVFGNVRPSTAMQHSPMGSTGPCVNLQCQQSVCAGGSSTTISGKVFDPAGNNPLYNVTVYVPNETLAALPTGATCDRCDSLYSGSPIAATLTDSSGSFTLEHAPDGQNIPLVVQIGKWRRQFVLPSVAACQDNPQADGMLRLPRNHQEGDIPNMAISTGMADTLECLLRRVGVDASEYVPGASPDGRIHIFQGAAITDAIAAFLPIPGLPASPNTMPPGPQSAAALWNTVDSLLGYDIVLLSCEGQETTGMNQQALHDYADAGGRVFASHFQYSWFNSGPYATSNLATWSAGANDLGDIKGQIVTALPDGRPFPKGQAMLEWLGNVGALQNGLLPIAQARHNADLSAMNVVSQPWILADQSTQMAAGATQYFSFDTPIEARDSPDAQYCGRVVFSDLHVGAVSGDNPFTPVPDECTTAKLSPQEAALEFMLFDLSSCLTPNERMPQPPPVL